MTTRIAAARASSRSGSSRASQRTHVLASVIAAAIGFVAAVFEDLYVTATGGQSIITDFLELFSDIPPGLQPWWVVSLLSVAGIAKDSSKAVKSFIDGFMQSLLSGASFTGTLDIRHFHSLQPRLQGPGAWWLESARRLRRERSCSRCRRAAGRGAR